MFTSAPFAIDDVTLFTSYGGLFGRTQCDVKLDFKSSFVAKRHRIFLRTFSMSFRTHLSFIVSQKCLC